MFVPVQINRIVSGDGGRLIRADARGPLPELRGKVQAVYCDPPFMTGQKYVRKRRFGELGWEKGSPQLQVHGYTDRFPDADAYSALLRDIAVNARDVLTDSGLFMLHLDWRVSAMARILCDGIFGSGCFVNELIWAYESGGRASRTFSRKHDTILIYGKTKDWRLDPMAAGVPRSIRRRSHMKRGVDEEGREYSIMVSGGKTYRYYDNDPISPGDVWTDISHLQQLDPERTGWPTQKPLKLLHRLLSCAVKPGEEVLELCCGSGTACAAADMLGCRWTGIDLSEEALVTTALRMEMKDLTLDMPVDPSDAALQGSVNDMGLLVLDAFIPPENAVFPPSAHPLDPLEAWMTGTLRDGVFTVRETFRRTLQHPALQPMALLEPDAGDPAVVCLDASGRAHAFTLVPERE